MLRVAPHAGAWIETVVEMTDAVNKLPSHPTRVRGLKQIAHKVIFTVVPVAPHAGAWIETRNTATSLLS